MISSNPQTCLAVVWPNFCGFICTEVCLILISSPRTHPAVLLSHPKEEEHWVDESIPKQFGYENNVSRNVVSRVPLGNKSVSV
jgi:hypothetical protein